MSETKENGEPAAIPKPSPQEVMMQQLRNWIVEIHGVTLRGIFASLAGRMNTETALIESCRAMGRLVGGLYVGEEVAVTKFRRLCRDAFKDGYNSILIQPMPKPAPSVETAAGALNRPQSSPVEKPEVTTSEPAAA